MSNFRPICIRSVSLNIRRARAIWAYCVAGVLLALACVVRTAEPWPFCAATRWLDPIHYLFAGYLIRLSMCTSNSSLSKSCSDILYILNTIKAQQDSCSLCFLHFSHDSVLCALSYFCCHFLKVETVIWRLSFFVPAAELLELAVDKSFSNVCVQVVFYRPL